MTDTIFEAFIQSYIDHNIGKSSSLISSSLAQRLRLQLMELQANDLLKLATTSQSVSTKYDATVRGDSIYWLDRKHNNEAENAFLDVMDAFVRYLNESCFTGITSYEFHFAWYAADTFYVKHIDQFQTNAQRKFSLITYLNPDWVLADGGQLRVYSGDSITDIDPLMGNSVLFKSQELAHEVLKTNVPRLSITGWLKVD